MLPSIFSKKTMHPFRVGREIFLFPNLGINNSYEVYKSRSWEEGTHANTLLIAHTPLLPILYCPKSPPFPSHFPPQKLKLCRSPKTKLSRLSPPLSSLSVTSVELLNPLPHYLFISTQVRSCIIQLETFIRSTGEGTLFLSRPGRRTRGVE